MEVKWATTYICYISFQHLYNQTSDKRNGEVSIRIEEVAEKEFSDKLNWSVVSWFRQYSNVLKRKKKKNETKNDRNTVARLNVSLCVTMNIIR